MWTKANTITEVQGVAEFGYKTRMKWNWHIPIVKTIRNEGAWWHQINRNTTYQVNPNMIVTYKIARCFIRNLLLLKEQIEKKTHDMSTESDNILSSWVTSNADGTRHTFRIKQSYLMYTILKLFTYSHCADLQILMKSQSSQQSDDYSFKFHCNPTTF